MDRAAAKRKRDVAPPQKGTIRQKRICGEHLIMDNMRKNQVLLTHLKQQQYNKSSDTTQQSNKMFASQQNKTIGGQSYSESSLIPVNNCRHCSPCASGPSPYSFPPPHNHPICSPGRSDLQYSPYTLVSIHYPHMQCNHSHEQYPPKHPYDCTSSCPSVSKTKHKSTTRTTSTKQTKETKPLPTGDCSSKAIVRGSPEIEQGEVGWCKCNAKNGMMLCTVLTGCSCFWLDTGCSSLCFCCKPGRGSRCLRAAVQRSAKGKYKIEVFTKSNLRKGVRAQELIPAYCLITQYNVPSTADGVGPEQDNFDSSSSPNATRERWFDDSGSYVGIFSSKEIQSGEEIILVK